MTAEAFSLEGLEQLAGNGITEVIIASRNPYDISLDTQTMEEKVSKIRAHDTLHCDGIGTGWSYSCMYTDTNR